MNISVPVRAYGSSVVAYLQSPQFARQVEETKSLLLFLGNCVATVLMVVLVTVAGVAVMVTQLTFTGACALYRFATPRLQKVGDLCLLYLVYFFMTTHEV